MAIALSGIGITIALVVLESKQGARATRWANWGFLLLVGSTVASTLALREGATPLRWGVLALSVASLTGYLYLTQVMSRLPGGASLDTGKRLPSGTWRRASTEALVPSDSIWENGPSLLVLYRGPWCAYCRGELEAFRETFKEQGIDRPIVALSHLHQEPRLMNLNRDVGDIVDLYQDPGGQWLRDADAFQAGGHPNGGGLAIPTLAWVDRDGEVLWSWRATDIRKRLSAAEAIEAAKDRGIL